MLSSDSHRSFSLLPGQLAEDRWRDSESSEPIGVDAVDLVREKAWWWQGEWGEGARTEDWSQSLWFVKIWQRQPIKAKAQKHMITQNVQSSQRISKYMSNIMKTSG